MSTATRTEQEMSTKTETKRDAPVPATWLGWAKPIAAFLPWMKKNVEARAAEEDIRFKPNGFLTLGVEIEMNLVDNKTGQLQNRGEEVLKNGAALLQKLKPEFCQDTVEVNTGICQDVHAAEADLKATFTSLSAICDELGLSLLTTGLHPTADYHDSRVYNAPRYKANVDRVRWLLRRSIAIGTHVHIGMNSPQECIRYNNFYLHFLPHFLALSASSPFWRGEDTGLFASRPTAYEAIPTAGQPNPLRDWAEFEELYWSMKRAGAIQSIKDLWWDVRPSPKYGTLEVRICDGGATLSETLAITAFMHLLAHWFADNLSWLDQMSRPPIWVARENKWRAMRYGLDADLVVTAAGDTKPLRADIEDWLQKLEPYAARLDYGEYLRTLRQILAQGNSAARQRAVFEKTKDLNDVIRFNLREFKNRTPLWEEVKLLTSKPALAPPATEKLAATA